MSIRRGSLETRCKGRICSSSRADSVNDGIHPSTCTATAFGGGRPWYIATIGADGMHFRYAQ